MGNEEETLLLAFSYQFIDFHQKKRDFFIKYVDIRNFCSDVNLSIDKLLTCQWRN